MVRDSINFMVKDLLKNSLINFKGQKIKKLTDVYNCKNKLICFSFEYENIINEIRDFLHSKMYKNKKVLKRIMREKKLLINYLKPYQIILESF